MYKNITRYIALFITIFVSTKILWAKQHMHDIQFSLVHEYSKKNQPVFESQLIPEPDTLLASHSATISALDDKGLLAMWFAGSHEARPDVKIWQSEYLDNKWQMAHIAISPKMIQDITGVYVGKVGNPVLFKSANGTLQLFVVAVAFGGWACSRIVHFTSTDNGKHWQFKQLLYLSPLLNYSTLVRANAIGTQDGGFYLPVYNEFINTYPELLYFDKNGDFIRQIKMSDINYVLQPVIVPLSNSVAYAYLRNKASQNENLYMQMSFNGGKNWGQLIKTNLHNHDSSLAVIRMSNGMFLMAHNIYQDRQHLATTATNTDKYAHDDRYFLSLAFSQDGIIWHDFYTLEHDPKYEFSYPTLIQDNGVIDLAYTWKRLRIKHIRFNQAWVIGQLK